MPRLNGSRSTVAPAAAAISGVRSMEPSATTTISKPGSKARMPSITSAIEASSFRAGTIAQRLSSAANRGSRAEAEQLEHPLGPPLVGVLVEDALARPPPQLLGLGRVGEQLAIGGDGLVRLLLDRERSEERGVGAPEDRLDAAGTELEQTLRAALRVRDEEVVLARIGAVVVVEARVHAAELRQAHRDVAVVEDDRHAETL